MTVLRRFEFRLEKVLGLYQQREKMQQRRLHRLLAELEQLRRRLDEAERRREQVFIMMTKAGQGGLSGSLLQWYGEQIEGLSRELQEKRRQLSEHEEMVAEARQDLAERVREREKLSRLRQKALARYRREVTRWEQALADEVNSTHHARKDDDLVEAWR